MASGEYRYALVGEFVLIDLPHIPIYVNKLFKIGVKLFKTADEANRNLCS